ncbi:hypothetical protein [Paenibacillus spongiae]|uniref:Uncharacterized protein n=1 Tax=Paenibacillus spongiae TaxID=2909671 RepID=A0ABY5S8G3_9BACL|nr:hypothetical protein [Paenibacillus spongiae]UVI30221.1 hypothetical protein L1F29_33470 [Paenibacillus spongiae]
MIVLKWLFAIIFHPIMIVVILFTLIMPFMLYGDLKKVLTYEVPTSNPTLIIISLISLFIYLAMKIKFLGKPYRKVTMLLPALQMIVYTCTALSIGLTLVNKWADEGLYSKGWAITLALLAIVAIRLGMSFLYWKYPIVQRKGDR